jgi:hypothetical protein
MSFVQLVSFHTDRIDAFMAREEQWRADTDGKRTLLADRLWVDRHDPRHFVSENVFSSYESAMVNSALPETDAAARDFMTIADGAVTFTDLDLLGEADDRVRLSEAARTTFETSTPVASAFAEDVVTDLMFPHHLGRTEGIAAFTAALRDEAPMRTVERWDSVPTDAGFVVEYAYRTGGSEESYLSVGVVLASVTGGRISGVLVTCAGAWDAAAEARIYGTVTA